MTEELFSDLPVHLQKRFWLDVELHQLHNLPRWLNGYTFDPAMVNHEGLTVIQKTLLGTSPFTEDVIAKLLDGGFHIDTKYTAGKAVSLACMYQPPRLLKKLLDAGATFSQYLPKSGNLLNYAARRGHYETVGLLLDHGADPNLLDGDGERYTPLMWASTSLTAGLHQVRDKLVQAGANPNATNTLGQNALHVAASKKAWDAMPHLARLGVDISLPDDQGQTPLGLARGREALIRAMEEGRMEFEASCLQKQTPDAASSLGRPRF